MDIRRRLVIPTSAWLFHRGWRWAQRHGAIGPHTPNPYRFASFGSGALLAFPPGCVYGEDKIAIGEQALIGELVTLSVGYAPEQDLGPDVRLRIGARTSIGRGSHVVVHESVTIGDDVFVAPYVYITDQNHTYAEPDVPVGRQWPVNAPVVIGDGCWLGTGSIVLPGSRLGRNVTVAGGSVVRGVFPDHCVIGGVPARVLRSFTPGSGWHAPAPAPADAGPAPAGAAPYDSRRQVAQDRRHGRARAPRRRGIRPLSPVKRPRVTDDTATP
ncbi:acyltransferase [Streptomyces sp. VRA16 Mangrove soil]|uniref:acyltransferase n=1 Tax=Streptomyces sp. VRA16 Mangrove soil TaxID=2817434 RepID=UPI001A9D01FE|nr:acyltransferase [Streptomyces sp. VRA16 Mangrove soil]MBO1330719.1 acyltransferase [Streptomyces sp. VRA16 Mangrove soil]